MQNMKKSYLFVLLILPVMLVLTAFILRYAHGPYYICSDTEQDYIYLISSLAMAESKQVFYTDHPGTTLQILGAVTLKISHVLDYSEKDSLEYAVLKNPEHYLTMINIVLIALNAMMLFVIGLVTYHLTKNIGWSLLLQFTPFFSGIPLRWGLIQVSCEPLLLFVSMLFMLVLLKMVVSENLSGSIIGYAIVLAVVSGFGVATKVTFAPLMLIPLIALPKLRNKMVYLFLSGLSFVLWTWPIHLLYERIFKRIYHIITHTGWYGTGSSGVIEIVSLKNNLMNALTGFLTEPVYPILFFFIPFAILLVVRHSKTVKATWKDISFRVMVAILFAQIFTGMIVVKQSAERYALPVLCLTGFLIFLIFIALQRHSDRGRLNNKKIIYIVFIIILFGGLWRAIAVKNLFTDYLQVKQESLTTQSITQNEYGNYLNISSYMTPSRITALCYGNYMTSYNYLYDDDMRRNIFSKGLYSSYLQNIYGEAYFYNKFSGRFYTFKDEFLIEDMIFKKNIDKIIFHCPPFFRNNNDMLPCMSGSVVYLRDVLKGTYDTIYVVEGIALGKDISRRIALKKQN